MAGRRKNAEKNVPEALKTPAEETLSISRWGDWKTWLTLAFMFLPLEIAIYSIERAHWINPQPSLTLTLLLAVMAVRLLTVPRLPGFAVHIIAVITGMLVTLWQGIIILPDGGGAERLFTILSSWLRGGNGLQEAEAKAIFGVALVLLTWLIGYLSTWFVLRRNNPWAAVGLGLIVVIVNLSNITEKNYIFFTLFLLASVLLVIQTRITGHRSPAGHGGGYSGKSLFYLVTSLFCITVLAVSISWVTPQVPHAVFTERPGGFHAVEAEPAEFRF